MDKVVELKNVTMNYHTLDGETQAIKNLSLDIRRGEFVSIVGPSGCGKSTLLSLISGLIKSSTGEILINNEPVKGLASNVGYMPQRDHLFEWLTILRNTTIGLEIQKKLNKDTMRNAERLLEEYGLGEFKYYYPNQLSGGMRQRAALIRTLAVNPEILLLDEPFSSLDYQTRLAISEEIWLIIKKEKKTAILVTHDIAEAVSMSDRIIVLTRRPGEVKSEHVIQLTTCENKTPIICREAPEFRIYFNKIWKELDVHV
ncbi:MAG TPA: ABC transporter ATP-binding protein [Bacillota bacterium]|nr:ABC transporter ATP-binding protein [Bacillota bacterium]HNT03893.1 ABC transporter ATP-binding protein [Bacillota bacterium]HNU80866.1 ABC transporter ATP-binding protein [Bacillota bacterium]HPA55313.1 ABC transporter ATP-binding protein [Bacillota bacterium]HPX68317.1 ABC transporter ATP-binding protein [Bacillota bacterium]